MAPKDGVVHSMLGAVRNCLSHFLQIVPPESDVEVLDILAELKITPRNLMYLYRTFQALKQHDPITMSTGPNEASVSSMRYLVVTHREHVEKILRLLSGIAGYEDVINWQGFVYVFLMFCTLSKLEVCQVMFYIIAKDMKSWTVNYLTSSQLEEFYAEFHTCPVPAFNTSTIDFARLPLAKYSLTDFIDLMYRFSQLINPAMHLQRALQQALPNLRFWRDYDRIKMHNRKITIDFFRHKKSLSIMEVLTGIRKVESHSEASLKVLALQNNTEQEILLMKENARRKAKEDPTRSPPVEGIVPMPLFALPPPKPKREILKQYPGWIEEKVKTNEDPLTGTALGSATITELVGADRPWQPTEAPPRSLAEAKGQIIETFGDPRPKPSEMKSQQLSLAAVVNKGVNAEQRLERITRSQELDFIRKSRYSELRRDNLVSILERSCPGELIDRPAKLVQGHL